MIYQPWQCNSLHPCTDKGNALPGEEQTVIPVLQRPEHRSDLQRYIAFQSPFQDDLKYSLNVLAFNIGPNPFVVLYPVINNYNKSTELKLSLNYSLYNIYCIGNAFFTFNIKKFLIYYLLMIFRVIQIQPIKKFPAICRSV